MGVERLTDLDDIRRRLSLDRDWALYPKADLDHAHRSYCDWYGYGDGVALIYRAFDPPALVVSGSRDAVTALLSDVPVDRADLAIREDDRDLASESWRFERENVLVRMMLAEPRLRPHGEAERLTLGHADEIDALLSTGDRTGVAFAHSQLATGCYFGLRSAGALIAVAGVHVVSEAEGAAAIGNVFTHADHRGRGLAQVTVSAVAAELLARRIPAIGLNVVKTNAPAAQAYTRLGFVPRLSFVQGPAVRCR